MGGSRRVNSFRRPAPGSPLFRSGKRNQNKRALLVRPMSADMTAVELFHKDGHSANVWYCGKCRIVAKTQEGAEKCCAERLCSCGKPLRRYSLKCNECDHRDFKAKCDREEEERFDKATKVLAKDWDGEQCYYEDHYFETVDEFMEWAEDNFINESHYPDYIWNAENQGVRKADIEDIITNCVDSLWEDADESDLNGVDELQAAVDAFNEANKSVKCYMVDFSTAIILDEIPQETGDSVDMAGQPSGFGDC